MHTALRKVAIIALVVIATGSRAAGIPVFDAANFANLIQSIGLTTKQLAELQRIYQSSIEMASQARWIHHSVTQGLDAKSVARALFEQEFTRWVHTNIPRDYQDLMKAGAQGGQLAAYLTQRQGSFPLLTAAQIDPWNPNGSPRAKHTMETQRVIDQSRAAAQLAYDQAGATLEKLLALQRQNTQPTLAASAQLANEIALAQAMLAERGRKLDALHQIREAQVASEGIEAQRRWNEFLGKPIQPRSKP